MGGRRIIQVSLCINISDPWLSEAWVRNYLKKRLEVTYDWITITTSKIKTKEIKEKAS